MDHSNRTRFWLAWLGGLLFAANCAVFNFVLAPVEKRADLTADRRYTLPEPIVRIARKLDPNEPVLVTVYLSEGLPQRFAHLSKALQTRLGDLRRESNGGLEYKFVDPKGDEELAQKIDKEDAIKPVPVQDLKSGSLTLANYYLSLVMRRGDLKEVVHLAELGGQLLADEELTLSAMSDFLAARLVKLTNPDVIVGILSAKKIPPAQGGQGGEATDGLKGVRERLSKHAKVQDVDIKDGKKIPPGVKALIVHRPENFGPLETYELDQFVMRGGRVILMLDNWSTYDPDRESAVAQAMLMQSLYALRKTPSGLEEWLAHYGFKLEDGALHDQSQFRTPIIVRGPQGFPVQQTLSLPGIVIVRSTDDEKKPTGQVEETEPTVAGLAPLPFILPAPVRLDDSASFGTRHPGASLSAFLRTSPEAWIAPELKESYPMAGQKAPGKELMGTYVLGSRAVGVLRSFYAGKPAPFREGTPEANRPPPPIESCADDQPGQIWVIADADFALDAWGAIAQRLQSAPLMQALQKTHAMLMNVVDAAAFGNELIDVRRPRLMDRTVDADRVAADRGKILFRNIFLAPLALVIFGLTRWWWRTSAAETFAFLRGLFRRRPTPPAGGDDAGPSHGDHGHGDHGHGDHGHGDHGHGDHGHGDHGHGDHGPAGHGRPAAEDHGAHGASDAHGSAHGVRA
jgi:hypothetical protein